MGLFGELNDLGNCITEKLGRETVIYPLHCVCRRGHRARDTTFPKPAAGTLLLGDTEHYPSHLFSFRRRMSFVIGPFPPVMGSFSQVANYDWEGVEVARFHTLGSFLYIWGLFF